MEIVRARPTDSSAVADLYLRSRAAAGAAIPPGVHPADDVRRHVAEVVVARLETYLAVRDSTPVGVLVLDGDDLDWLYVSPEAQGDGVGSALVDHAKSVRPGGLALWTFVSNEPARRFYRKHGFAVVGGTDGDNEEGAPDLRLQWFGDPQG